MDYEKKYKEILERAKEKYPTCYSPALLEYIFPELKENEDEKIRKWIIDDIRYNMNNEPISSSEYKKQAEKAITWLEKQGSEPNWYHHKVDLSDCSEEYRKAYYDGWNNCNMQHSQYKSESNDVVKCLINGMKFYYEDNEEATWGTEKFSMKVKDILSWLEKQGEQKSIDKFEPKFKVGDWISNDMCDVHIASIEDGMYYFDEGDGLSIVFVDEHYHLWTIEDAMDGDVLANDHHILILKELVYDWSSNGTSYSVKAYCGIKPNGNFEIGKDNWSFCGTLHIHPATKEQRDTLFAKMKKAGYAFNFEKKELKKLGQSEVTKTSDQEEIAEIPFGGKR